MPDFPNFAFFGTDEFAVAVLKRLAEEKIRPSLIVTTPDRPQGKHLKLLPSPVKIWAEENKLPYLQPEDFKSLPQKLQTNSYMLFLVASYGKIIPSLIFNLPKYGTLNIHPSPLPKYRGPTPIQDTILNGEEKTGVTLMLLDEKLDHGPILKAESYKLEARNFIEIRDDLAELGAQLFIDIAPLWISDKIKARPQDHAQATYTKKIKKENGLINFTDNPVLNYRKFLAYQPWPGAYFFVDRNGKRTRVIITAAHLTNNQFIIDRVKPEGKKEMVYTDFKRGFKKRSVAK